MGVRRRAVRERVERAQRNAKDYADFSESLARIKRVVDEAIADGLTNLTPEEFGRRLRAFSASKEPT